ncbi:MAG TPA: hypothetical protein VN282_16970 [Pyrinomonadaceae bacterium]|nr:hypothetical protein [Pyrinomonadaceae bacterium]
MLDQLELELEDEFEAEAGQMMRRADASVARGPRREVAAGSFSNYDVIDSRIDVSAQKALIRMRGNPATSADAAAMLAAVKGGRLAGIYGDALLAAAQLAARLGTVRWKLVPPGRVAALVRERNPAAPPTIIFRESARGNPAQLDPALLAAWREFGAAAPGGRSRRLVPHPDFGYVWLLGPDAPPPAAMMSPRLRAPARSSSAEYSVIGEDERRPQRNTLPVPYRFICKLQLVFTHPAFPGSRTNLAHGSGVLISDRHVLTAAHNLFNSALPGVTQRVRPSMIIVSPGMTSGGRQPFGSSFTNMVRFPPEWLASPDRDFDFGLITLTDRLGAVRHPALGNRPLGFWGSPQLGGGTRIEVTPLAQMTGLGVRLSGYSGDKCDDQPTRGSFTIEQIDENCTVGLHATLQWESAGNIVHPVPPGFRRILTHNCDTFGGNSGCPIWATRRGLNMVGIHTGPFPPTAIESGNENLNRAVRITHPVLQQLRRWMQQDGVTPTF